MSSVRRIAETGWLFEVVLLEANQQSDSRFFAVGFANATAAQEAVLRYQVFCKATRGVRDAHYLTGNCRDWD
jgi:hypothetical protein